LVEEACTGDGSDDGDAENRGNRQERQAVNLATIRELFTYNDWSRDRLIVERAAAVALLET
jgi:hypothetical protein